MNLVQKGIIRKNYIKLQKQTIVDEIFLSYFIQNSVLLEDQVEHILMPFRTKTAKSREFLEIIQKRGPQAWDVWYDALIATNQFEVADILKPDLAPSRNRSIQAHPESETAGAASGLFNYDPGQAHGSGQGQVQNTVPPGGAAVGAQGGPGNMTGFTDERDSINEASGNSFATGHHHSQPHESISLVSSGSNSAQPVRTGIDDDAADYSEEDDPPYLNGDNVNLYIMDDLKVKNTTLPKYIKLFEQSDTVNNRKVYTMLHKQRGRALIINNQYFDQRADSKEGQKRLSERDGSEIDLKNLKTFFKNMGIKPVVKHDQRSEELIPAIIDETRNEEHEHSDLFVLVIMSHGDKDVVYGVDGVEVNLLDIYDVLSGTRFPIMAEKPKVVLIQACAGVKADPGYKNHRMDELKNVSDSSLYTQDASVAPSESEQIKGLDKEHFLIVTACFDSYKSMRHKDMGTWFIRAVIDVFSKHAAHRHAEDLLKEVRTRVKYACIATMKRRGEKDLLGQVPVTRTTLSRDLYLFPGLYKIEW